MRSLRRLRSCKRSDANLRRKSGSQSLSNPIHVYRATGAAISAAPYNITLLHFTPHSHQLHSALCTACALKLGIADVWRHTRELYLGYINYYICCTIQYDVRFKRTVVGRPWGHTKQRLKSILCYNNLIMLWNVCMRFISVGSFMFLSRPHVQIETENMPEFGKDAINKQ